MNSYSRRQAVVVAPEARRSDARRSGAPWPAIRTRCGRWHLLLLVLVALGLAPVQASLLEAEGAREFVEEVAERHNLNAAELRGMFRRLERQDAVLEAVQRPAEALPWYRYRPIFVTDTRAEAGAEFRAEHLDTLQRAEAEYGVPVDVIVAIIGVETLYGRRAGTHPVMATLATLAFEYPPRASFFRSELEHFLLLTREEQIDPTTVKGSYAGAMGMPQFISSSYRHYAVDFSGDGRRDLLNNTEDAIGSVAAYLADHRWEEGGRLVAPATAQGDAYRDLLGDGLRANVTGADLRAAGVEAEPMPAPDQAVSLMEFELEEGHELWVGWPNFHVITRYNHSPLYALAVVQLAERIREWADD